MHNTGSETVDVATCLEELPLGRTHWQAIFCGFLAWFTLGALSETTPLPFYYISEEWALSAPQVAMMSLALMAGNCAAILAGGWLADVFGRMAVLKPALFCTAICGCLMPASTTLAHALILRFTIGLLAGFLLCLAPLLISEMLPSYNRGFYMTIYCCGWPMGALYGLGWATMLEGSLGWRMFYALMAAPALLLYIAFWCGLLQESPRYLYLVNRREEGYAVLKLMYERQDQDFPWSPEQICSSAAPRKKGRRSPVRTFTGWPRSAVVTIVWVFLAALMKNCGSQANKTWMPSLLSTSESASLLSISDSSSTVDAAVRYFAAASAPQQGVEPLSRGVLLELSHGYVVEACGIIFLAFASPYLSRSAMVQGSFFVACLTTSGAIVAGHLQYIRICSMLIGIQLIAQGASANFLRTFIAEYFLTSRRATAMSIFVLGMQIGSIVMPVLGGVIVARMSVETGIACFSFCYGIGWWASMWLPLQSVAEKKMHDLDDEATVEGCGGGGTFQQSPDTDV